MNREDDTIPETVIEFVVLLAASAYTGANFCIDIIEDKFFLVTLAQ